MKIINEFPVVLKQLRFKYRIVLWHFFRLIRNSLTITTKQGVFTLPLDTDDPISKHLFAKGEFELDLTIDAMQIIRRSTPLTKGKGTLLDIGANNGVISIGMITTGQMQSAIAIEPEPQNFANLQRNVDVNGLKDKVTCLNYAVSDKKSTLVFELSQRNSGDHRVRNESIDTKLEDSFDESSRSTIIIESQALDTLLLDIDRALCKDISVVWIDVQGHEGYVFLGAKELLSRGVPVVSEIWPYGIQRSGMSKETYCAIVRETWSNFWVKREDGFVQHEIALFESYYDELGYHRESSSNVIFMK